MRPSLASLPVAHLAGGPAAELDHVAGASKARETVPTVRVEDEDGLTGAGLVDDVLDECFVVAETTCELCQERPGGPGGTNLE